MSSGNVSNVAGIFAPEQALSGFTGDPNGVWTLSICDHGAGQVGYVRYVRLNFCTVPEVTASASNSPICGGDVLDLNVNATGTAPLTYAWTGTGAFSPGTSSQNPSVIGAVTGEYAVTVSNACGFAKTTIPVTVTDPPSASITYAGTPYCSTAGTASVIHTGTTGGTYSSTSGLSIDSSTGAVDLGASTPGTYTVNYTIAAADGCGAFNTSTNVTIASCNYYSQGSGDVNSAIWATTPVGTPVAVTWNSATSLVIQAGDTITVSADVAINDLTTEAASRLVINAGNTLYVHGDQLTLAQFSVSAASGEVALESTSPVTIAVTGTVAFNDLTVNVGAGVTVTGGLNIFGTLQLNDGAFNASGATVQLRSDATRTGRLGPVDPSASYTGDLTVQRYIPGGATNWRLLGSPVASETVNDWKDDFFTAGFPGSHYPNFYDPPGSGILWPSVRKYDETVADASMNAGMVGVTGAAEALATGRGYAVWSGDNQGGTNPFLVDVTGAPIVAHTPIALPITWTNSGNPAADGYNLVSNPLPSPIDFASISRGADVQNYYWIYNPANGNNATWNGLVGTNGANGIIQSSQGFWLKADGPAVITTVSESAKVSGNTGGVFGGSQDGPMPMVRLHLTSTVNSYSDETVVVFAEGTPAYEEGDVAKFVFSHPVAPQIATRSSDEHNLAISMYGEFAETISIPVLVNVAVNGTYTVTASQLEGVAGSSCLTLEDLQTGIITPLTEGATYSFVALANDDESEPRLILHATAPLQRTLAPVTCHGANDGAVSVSLPGVSSGSVAWMTAAGQVIAEGALSNGTASINGLQPGNYSVSVNLGGICTAIINDFTITEPFALEVQADVMGASCPGQSDGQIAINVLGGTAPHAFTWSTGGTESSINVTAGSYTVTVTDANGCTLEGTYTVESGPAVSVGITVDQPVVLLGNAIQFGTSVDDYDEVHWDFGDGTTSEQPAIAHIFTTPGTFTVTQTIILGACSNSTTTEVVVELATGIDGAQQEGITARVEGDHIVILHPEDTRQLRYELRDAAGRLVIDRMTTGSIGRVLVPVQELNTGVWMLTVRSGEVVRTFRLPVVR